MIFHMDMDFVHLVACLFIGNGLNGLQMFTSDPNTSWIYVLVDYRGIVILYLDVPFRFESVMYCHWFNVNEGSIRIRNGWGRALIAF